MKRKKLSNTLNTTSKYNTLTNVCVRGESKFVYFTFKGNRFNSVFVLLSLWRIYSWIFQTEKGEEFNGIKLFFFSSIFCCVLFCYFFDSTLYCFDWVFCGRYDLFSFAFSKKKKLLNTMRFCYSRVLNLAFCI